MEHNKMKIAIGIVREKVQLEDQGNTAKTGGRDPLPSRKPGVPLGLSTS